MADFAAFSYQLPDNHRHSIVIDVEILVPVPIQGYPQNQKIPLKAKALIDTGASRSAISHAFADAAKLVSYEKRTIRMAKGEYISWYIPSTFFFLTICWHKIFERLNFRTAIILISL